MHLGNIYLFHLLQHDHKPMGHIWYVLSNVTNSFSMLPSNISTLAYARVFHNSQPTIEDSLESMTSFTYQYPLYGYEVLNISCLCSRYSPKVSLSRCLNRHLESLVCFSYYTLQNRLIFFFIRGLTVMWLAAHVGNIGRYPGSLDKAPLLIGQLHRISCLANCTYSFIQ